MNRRSFFNTMLGTAPVAAATLAMTTHQTSPEPSVEFLEPMCPSCCCLFNVLELVPASTAAERVERGSAPVHTTCQYCGWQGNVTFYRRQ